MGMPNHKTTEAQHRYESAAQKAVQLSKRRDAILYALNTRLGMGPADDVLQVKKKLDRVEEEYRVALDAMRVAEAALGKVA